MSIQPTISVVILTYNIKDFVEPAMRSIFEQNYTGSLQIIVCDDCSTDGTYEHAQCVADSYAGPHQVIVHKCAQNGKVSQNMNTAVSLATGEWIMRLDGDDIAHPDRVRIMAWALAKYPHAAVVTGKLISFENGTTPPSVSVPADEEIITSEVTYLDFCANTNPPFEWWGTAMMMHRRIFTEFGLIPIGCDVLDDTLFAARSLLAGSYVTLTNVPLLYYRRHGNNMSSPQREDKTPWSRYQGELATEHYYKKGLPCHAMIMDDLAALIQQLHPPTPEAYMEHWQRHLLQKRHEALWWDYSHAKRVQLLQERGAFDIPALPAFLTWLGATCRPMHSLIAWYRTLKQAKKKHTTT